jgi:hypothetical protein
MDLADSGFFKNQVEVLEDALVQSLVPTET